MGWSRFLRRGYWDNERAREIQSYIEIETDENIALGMSPEEAVSAARRKFGNVTFIREEIYRMNTIELVETLWRDLRHAFRSLRRNRGFAITVILTLALGIGANTTVFSVVDAVTFRPLPYREPSRLVSFAWVAARGSADQVTYVGGESIQEMEDWRAQKQIFAGVEPYSESRPTVGPNGLMEPMTVVWISTGMLDLLGMQPKLGRGFQPEEAQPGKDQVALLSHGYWEREFGADPAIVGKTITLSNHVYTVVGVMPQDFQFPIGMKPNAWVPWTEKSGGNLSFVARLRPGLSLQQAEREAALVSDRIYYRGRVPWAKMTPEFRPLSDRLNSRFPEETRTVLLVMLGSVGFVLLIACANVANLLLSRGATLQREVAIRAAIGASRSQLVRYFLVESMVLSVAGALAAILLAQWMIHLLPTILPAELQRLFRAYKLSLSGRVFAFTGAVTMLACLLSSLIPAFRAAHGGVIGGLTGTSRVAGVTRATRRLHVAFQSLQVGLALILLCGAGLMANSLVRMIRTQNGFETKHLCQVSVSLPSNPQIAQQQAFFDQLPAIAKALPGVLAATISGGTPATQGFGGGQLFTDEANDANAEPWGMAVFFVTPDFFSTLQIPLMSGRTFSPEDGPSSPPVAIIDRRAADHFWPGQSALGKRFRSGSRSPWVTIVGTASPVKILDFTRANSCQIYRPLSQRGSTLGNNLTIRTAGDPGPVLALVRNRIAALNPNATIRTAATFDELYAIMDTRTVATPRFYLVLMSIFAGVALATAAVGVYGVLSYSVTRRTSEIGIRVALGAGANDIRRLILRSAIAPVLAGILIGFIGSFWLTRLLKSLLYQVAPHDPFTMILVAGLMLIVAFLATILPTRRARRVDPIIALRVE
jgi:putative ABC transport system permease protein